MALGKYDKKEEIQLFICNQPITTAFKLEIEVSGSLELGRMLYCFKHLNSSIQAGSHGNSCATELASIT